MEVKGNSKKKCVIVFSGFNQRAVISCLRTLHKNKINYAIVAKSEEDGIFLTDYKNKVCAIRQSIQLNKEDLIKSIKEVQKEKIADEYIIAPSTEALNRFLLKNRVAFEEYRCIIPLVSEDLYEMISDKYSFAHLCSEANILVPKEVNYKEGHLYPLVAKPKCYFSTKTKQTLSPIIINNFIELEGFFRNYDKKEFYFQEFINGRSFYLLYYFHRDGTIFKFSQENLLQQPGGKSMVAAISSDFHKTSESRKYEDLFKKIRFFGFVMIEVRGDNDKFYMIEANPRFWGPSQLFVDANKNFFEAFFHDFGLIKSIGKFTDPSEKIKYFWFGGLGEIFRKNQKPILHQYNEKDWVESFPEWLESDIHRRPDTKLIFQKELFQ
jgi:predicted ATP-grasp superfamily ATP-dependent carboligase